MPEYLAPGVYIEEVSYRSKSIEGVSTSTAGFVGPARFGPIEGHPELLVSFADFERIYGGIEDLGTGSVNYLAHGVRAFFEEGGKRLYVMRVAAADALPAEALLGEAPEEDEEGEVSLLMARFPGVAGNMRIRISLKRGDSILGKDGTLKRVEAGDVVYVTESAADEEDEDAPPTQRGLYRIIVDPETVDSPTRKLILQRGEGDEAVTLNPEDLEGTDDKTVAVIPITVIVESARPLLDGFGPLQLLGEYSLNPKRTNALAKTFVDKPTTRLAELTIPFVIKKRVQTAVPDPDDPDNRDADTIVTTYEPIGDDPLDLLTLLIPDLDGKKLDNRDETFSVLLIMRGGADGSSPSPIEYKGADKTDTSDVKGLKAFEAVADISIIAAPGYSADVFNAFAIQGALIDHCETMKYRIAVLDTPSDLTVTGALAFRNQRSSTHAALYYPWVYVADPRPARPGEPVKRLKLPPSGFIAGIYARNDIEHAVFKAPANEVVRLAMDFEQRLSKAQQEALNPEGVNCFRFFEGRGFLVWGARTISDDPEWKYVNLRRYFAYLERSIERGTQWAVFENNNTPLWSNVRRTIEDFLYNEWKSGGLMGDKPEQAYFVRCDRSTMTQNDIDNGRLICLIGVAPVRPAEFVIFRIGQWTADAQQ